MTTTLQKVIDYIKNEHKNLESITIIAHSLGCVIAACAEIEELDQYLLLAPPIDVIYPWFKREFSNRVDTRWSDTGTIEIARSDGSTTFLEQDFLADLRRVNPLAGFAQLAEQVPVTIIQAADDHIVTDSYEPVKDIEKIQLLRIPGKHNFEGEARAELVKLIRRLLN